MGIDNMHLNAVYTMRFNPLNNCMLIKHSVEIDRASAHARIHNVKLHVDLPISQLLVKLTVFSPLVVTKYVCVLSGMSFKRLNHELQTKSHLFRLHDCVVHIWFRLCM